MTIEQDLLRDEGGLRLYPYDDATGQQLKPGDVLRGNITIGCGRNLSEQGLHRDEAQALLAYDIQQARSELARALPFWHRLSALRQVALINMRFNLGLTQFRKFENMISALAQGNYAGAGQHALASTWHQQVGKRAERIAWMLINDTEPPRNL